MREVYTIGYEGTDIRSFIETLSALNIELVADVRAVPISRKKGFSKNKLREALSEHGISYQHFRELGDPKPGRDAAKAGDFSTFEAIFNAHMEEDASLRELNTLAEIAQEQVTCLLCFERQAVKCHRSIISRHLHDSGFCIYNLSVDNREAYSKNATEIPRYYPRESLAAAE